MREKRNGKNRDKENAVRIIAWETNWAMQAHRRAKMTSSKPQYAYFI